MLDQPTDAGFLCAFTHMSLTYDPRSLVNVPKEVIETLPPNPEIEELSLNTDRHIVFLAIRHLKSV